MRDLLSLRQGEAPFYACQFDAIRWQDARRARWRFPGDVALFPRRPKGGRSTRGKLRVRLRALGATRRRAADTGASLAVCCSGGGFPAGRGGYGGMLMVSGAEARIPWLAVIVPAPGGQRSPARSREPETLRSTTGKSRPHDAVREHTQVGPLR